MSSDRELIYIDNNNDIKKLSEDLKLTKVFFETKNSRWHPLCVHCCKLTGDILVGTKRKKETQTIDLDFSDLDENENQGNLTSCKVTRYNKTGEETLTIQLNNNGLQLYKLPIYITENKNGDVVVSDNKDAVVVEVNIVSRTQGFHQGQKYHHVGFVPTPCHTSWWLTLLPKQSL